MNQFLLAPIDVVWQACAATVACISLTSRAGRFTSCCAVLWCSSHMSCRRVYPIPAAVRRVVILVRDGSTRVDPTFQKRLAAFDQKKLLVVHYHRLSPASRSAGVVPVSSTTPCSPAACRFRLPNPGSRKFGIAGNRLLHPLFAPLSPCCRCDAGSW